MLQILIIDNRDLVHAQTFCTRVGNEGVKHKFNKFEEQKNEIIKSVVLILVLKKKKCFWETPNYESQGGSSDF